MLAIQLLFVRGDLLAQLDHLLAHPAVGRVLVGAFVPVQVGFNRRHVVDRQVEPMQLMAAGKALEAGGLARLGVAGKVVDWLSVGSFLIARCRARGLSFFEAESSPRRRFSEVLFI